MKFDDNDEQIADAVEDIVTQMIHVHVGTNEDPSFWAKHMIVEESFSRLTHVYEVTSQLLLLPIFKIPHFHTKLWLSFLRKYLKIILKAYWFTQV